MLGKSNYSEEFVLNKTAFLTPPNRKMIRFDSRHLKGKHDMNIKAKLSLVSLLMLGVACGAKPSTWAVTQSLRNYSVSLKEMAANQIYLNDSVDAIAADGSVEVSVTPELAAAQVKMATAKIALAEADKILAEASQAADEALATAKASTKVALDLAQAAKSNTALKAQAAAADAKARADGALVDDATSVKQKAQAAQQIAAAALAQAEKVVIAQGGDINGTAGEAAARAQIELQAAQDALIAAKAASLKAQNEARQLKAEALDLAQSALADASLQAQADAAAAASDEAALKATAATDAEALAAAEVAKAEAALAAANGVVGEAPAVEGDAEAVDPITEEDVKPNRIGQMVAQLFVTLDVNADDSLDVTEFLKITEVKKGAGAVADLSADQLAALETKLTAKFAQFAGADNLMTDVELAAFLKGQKNRVCNHRRRQGQAGTSTRALSVEQLLTKFDANSDGVIDLSELTALKAAMSSGTSKRR